MPDWLVSVPVGRQYKTQILLTLQQRPKTVRISNSDPGKVCVIFCKRDNIYEEQLNFSFLAF